MFFALFLYHNCFKVYGLSRSINTSICKDKRLLPDNLDESLTEHNCQVPLCWDKEDCFVEIMVVFHSLHTFNFITKAFLFTILWDNKKENLTLIVVIKLLINARKIQTKNKTLNLFSYSFSNPSESPMSVDFVKKLHIVSSKCSG